MRYNDLTGKTFGWLTVLEKDNTIKSKEARWMCKCRCGNIKTIRAASLTRGATVSCECKKKSYKHSVRHGMYKTRIFRIWRDMKGRCKSTGYQKKYYLDRGIKVCKRWENFENFYEDMSSTYQDNLTIDRIDNNKGYYKKNCRWVDMKTQAGNTRHAWEVKYKGKKMSLPDFCRQEKVLYTTMTNRIYNVPHIITEKFIGISIKKKYPQV